MTLRDLWLEQEAMRLALHKLVERAHKASGAERSKLTRLVIRTDRAAQAATDSYRDALARAKQQEAAE